MATHKELFYDIKGMIGRVSRNLKIKLTGQQIVDLYGRFIPKSIDFETAILEHTENKFKYTEEELEVKSEIERVIQDWVDNGKIYARVDLGNVSRQTKLNRVKEYARAYYPEYWSDLNKKPLKKKKLRVPVSIDKGQDSYGKTVVKKQDSEMVKVYDEFLGKYVYMRKYKE